MEERIKELKKQYWDKYGIPPNSIIMGYKKFDEVPMDLIECRETYDTVAGLVLFRIKEDVMFVSNTSFGGIEWTLVINAQIDK